ncbi:MAG: glycosyltransferase family 1 protein [Caldilineaceae bacterium]|nr:glycosyltransferase family 1 protein [Caldilineaceae bacterium]
MRIFEIIESSTNLLLPSNRTWYRNLYEPLVEMGHDVILFAAEEGRQAMQSHNSEARARFSQKLLGAFQAEQAKAPIDLVFAYLMDGMIDVGVIDEIRKYGVPTCNFSCNNAHQFDLVDELSPHFDFNLHAEKAAREKFLSIAANPLWWPMASNPRYFKPQNEDRSVAVSFVGANYALRAQYIAHLLENNIDVHAYGPGWVGRQTAFLKRYKLLLQALIPVSPQACYRASAALAEHDQRLYLRSQFSRNLHPPVSDEELVALYSRSQISVGFLEVYDQHDASRPVTQHLHLREFEAPMCGALYCTGYMDELAEMFEPEREVITYRSPYEMLDKVRYYLAHPTEAEKVRQAGHARALHEHTYHHRFETLFQKIGLKDS